MGFPYHISSASTSRLFSQDRHSAEYRAISMIAESLAHPQRTLLSAFIEQAVDRELASRFFLDEVSGQDKVAISEFLADWIILLTKVRPVAGSNIAQSLQRDILRRDGSRCCISERKTNGRSLLFVYILPPWLFCDDNMASNGRLYRMLTAYIGEPQLLELRSLMSQESRSSGQDCSDQLILLSPREFEHFRNGRHSLKSVLSVPTKDSAQYLVEMREHIPYTHVETFHIITLENKAIGVASLPNAQLLEVHDRFADALAWLEVSEYMKQIGNPPYNSQLQKAASFTKQLLKNKSFWGWWHLPYVSHIFQHVWVQIPALFRATLYRHLARIANRLYGYTGSDRTYRLPFNLYLRVANSGWASKHRAECQSFRLVEEFTRVPAPRVIDTVQYDDSSFLLMTGLPGNPIGRMISIMTDEQLQAVGQDLKEYVSELQQIPNKTNSEFQICNALGGGILDWRIGDSQREELRFPDEKQFNQYLTDDLPLDEESWKVISKSHSVEHGIVFTHADLNLRNILVDENGKISGIVDWECAGWYPEYWEYTKAHFTVRYTIRWLADVIDQVFPDYRNELQVEDLLSSMAPSW